MLLTLYIVVALLVLLAANVAGGWLLARRHTAWLRRACEGSVVLTYDDGPGQRLEARLLELLDRHRAKATFFVVGARVEEMPERCAALAEHGHEVASHGHAHLHAWRVSPWRVWADMARGFRAIARWSRDPVPYRPPHGKLTVLGWLRLRSRGMPLAKWTIDSGDTWSETQRSVQRVVDAVAADRGGVVLLHSFDRRSGTGIEDFVVEVTQALLQRAETEGLAVRTYSAMLNAS